MTDVTEGLRKITDTLKKPEAVDDFMHHRTEIHGALIRAHLALSNGRNWSPVETRIIDIIDQWLKQVRGP